MGIRVGHIALRNTVFLAPMSGVTDEPFRLAACRFGAGLVVSEMVASEELVRERPDVLRRATGAGKLSPFAVQLAGREARWMGEGVRIAQDLGADIIDINMGCPARQVTKGLAGSALMRDPDHALALIAATVAAASVPVTLKLRLGWDDGARNAPEIARRAEATGIAMVTVHGRTRCQFFKGSADWQAIGRVKDAVSIPLVANGDARSLADVRRMLRLSGADGVMIGRGACGRPWLPGTIADALQPGTGCPEPSPAQKSAALQEQYDAMLSHYGVELGLRAARKHLGWAVDALAEEGTFSAETGRAWRARLCRSEDPRAVRRGIAELFARTEERRAA